MSNWLQNEANETQKRTKKNLKKNWAIDEQLDMNHQNETLDSEIQMFQNALELIS